MVERLRGRRNSEKRLKRREYKIHPSNYIKARQRWAVLQDCNHKGGLMGEEIDIRRVADATPKEIIVWVEMSEPDIVGPHIVREPPQQLEKFAVELNDGLIITRNGEVYRETPKGIIKVRERYGARRVFIGVRGKSKSIEVHVAVARAFLDNPANLRFVRVLDGDKNNAQVDNLRWSSFNAKGAVKFRRKGLAMEKDRWKYRELQTPSSSGNPVYIMSKV